MRNEHIRNIAFDIVVTILTCGLFNLYVQYKQIDAVNHMLGNSKYSFLMWLLFTILTCGLYHIYHEYRMSTDIAERLEKPSDNAGLIAILLTIFGLSIALDAIQQSEINKFYGDQNL